MKRTRFKKLFKLEGNAPAFPHVGVGKIALKAQFTKPPRQRRSVALQFNNVELVGYIGENL